MVQLRGHIVEAIRAQPRNSTSLRALSEQLRQCLAEWFSVGLLKLERITWNGSSAGFLELVMQSEAVHPMLSWEDLKHRLGGGYRVFAFCHPSMPSLPLVVLHVAMMDAIPSNMQEVLSTDCRPGEHGEPAAAVFYSISASQPGLSGVDLGNFLIKKVALQLKVDFPALQDLATLSPLPNFRMWLEKQRHMVPAMKNPLNIPQACRHRLVSAAPNQGDFWETLWWALEGDRWLTDSGLEGALRPVLLRLAAWYLVVERRRSLALDPVANFHLQNGAWLSRINWRANVSSRGLGQSCGMMVNYTYRLDDVEVNNHRYLVENKVALEACAAQHLGEPEEIRKLAKVHLREVA
eukprot:evm.model.scf_794.3 EVM.evm.TU.scf_794.3   scf_794:43392-50421(-)